MHPFWKQHGKRRGVWFIPEYVRLTGDTNSAILLCQLLYWFRPGPGGKSKATIERDGKQWVAKSREELMVECGLTLNCYRAAARRLEKLGVIHRETHLFNGHTRSHLTINPDRLLALVGWNSPSQQGEFHPPGKVKFTLPLSEAETTTETTTDTFACEKPHAKTPTEDHLQSLQDEDPDLMEGSQMPTAKEILERIKQAKDTSKIAPKQGVHWLEMRWKQVLSHHSDGFIKGFTVQERGQLKLLIVAVGGMEKAKEIIDFILPRWGEFAFEVKSAYGLATAPDKPVVGFLLKYHDVAVQLSAEPKQMPVHQTPTPPVAKPPQEPQLEPDETVTKEAVQAALASIKGG